MPSSMDSAETSASHPRSTKPSAVQPFHTAIPQTTPIKSTVGGPTVVGTGVAANATATATDRSAAGPYILNRGFQAPRRDQ